MESSRRLILIDGLTATREILTRRLQAQGFVVDSVADCAAGAERALAAPPAAVIADLWGPGISGVQLCRLLRSEPATAVVPIVLRGDHDDPRSRFWAERAGAFAFVPRGRVGELLKMVAKAVASAPADDGFFFQLAGESVDIRDRIARHLDAALFESVIAGEVRALAGTCSFERLFDSFSQLVSQVALYRWLALAVDSPARLALHTSPRVGNQAVIEALEALGVGPDPYMFYLEDDDAYGDEEGPSPIVREIAFAGGFVGRLALAPVKANQEVEDLVSLLGRELGGPLRIASLVAESQRLATTDHLTGLLNRRAFMDVVTAELSRVQRYGPPLMLLVLDVDHFKRINDQRGHNVGDRVLESLAVVLRQELRLSDTIARWGGEEFVVALPETEDAAVAERLRCAVEKLDVRDDRGEHVPVTVSIGGAAALRTDSLESLVQRADMSMYEAKAKGRNQCVVAPALAEGLKTVPVTLRPEPKSAA